MAQVIININHREYAISCGDGEEVSIIKLGRILDEKAQSLTKALGQINENQLLAMVGLLVADELNDTKKELAELKAQTPAPIVTPAPTVAPAPVNSNTVSTEELNLLDDELAKHLNSLNETIKSIALKLKSI